MEFYRAGCVVSPYHIPLILTPPPPPPTPPQALHYSDSFYSLLSASWRLPGLARLATCPGTGPAGHSLTSADESSKGQEAGFLGELGQIGLFRAPGGKIYLQTPKKWFTQCLQESGILVFKTSTPMLPHSFPPHLHPRVIQDTGCGG